MKHFRFLFIGLIGAIIFSSCVTSRKVNLMQDPDKRIPTYGDTLSYEDYLLRKGDRLFIYVYSIDEKTTKLFNSGQSNIRQFARGNMGGQYGSSSDLYTYVVDEEGYIQFPTIDKLYVRGKTTRQVKHMLEEELSGLVHSLGNMSMLSVEVQVVQRSFSIIGPNKSGRYNIPKEKVTIFEALALAGDLGNTSDRTSVMLIREVEDSTIVKTFDLRSKEIVNSEFYYIEPNDVLYIRNMRGYSFGLTHVSSVISIVASTISFGVFIYSLEERIRLAAVNAKKNSGSSEAPTRHLPAMNMQRKGGQP